jgi:hypothetical protein
MPNKSPKKTPARAANKAASKAARTRTPSRKANEASAAAASDGEEVTAAAADDNELKTAAAGDNKKDTTAPDDKKETAVDDKKETAVDDEKEAAPDFDDDAPVTMAQLHAMLSRLSPAVMAAAFQEQAAKPLASGSDFSDVSESDGEGTRSVLPPRAVADSGPSRRLRGGQDRLAGRKSGLRRTHAADLTSDEMERVERTLATGAKVPSFSRARARGHRFGRPSSLAMDMLVDEGELPPSGDADRTMASIFETFRAKSAKAARKEVKTYPTFGAWFDRYSEMGFLSRERMQEDPDTYWCFDWHLKCMLHIMAEYDWATASAYHARIIKRWDRLDHEAMAYGDDAACGDWEASLHTDSLYAVQLKPKSKTGKYDKSDWFCKPCGKYFPKTANHSSSCPKKAAAPVPGRGKPKP